MWRTWAKVPFFAKEGKLITQFCERYVCFLWKICFYWIKGWKWTIVLNKIKATSWPWPYFLKHLKFCQSFLLGMIQMWQCLFLQGGGVKISHEYVIDDESSFMSFFVHSLSLYKFGVHKDFSVANFGYFKVNFYLICNHSSCITL